MVLPIFENMKYTRYVISLAFAFLIANYCQSQDKEYAVIIPTKVEIKFDSLYPQSSNINWNKRHASDNIQVVEFDCRCDEGMGHLTITFDTIGIITNKEILIYKQNLPENIISYIENNYPNGFKYGAIDETINNQGEITYSTDMLQTTPDGNVINGGWTYVLKFKASGEFISVEKVVTR